MCNLLLLGEELNLQLQKSFGSIFLMLPMKVAKGSIVVREIPGPRLLVTALVIFLEPEYSKAFSRLVLLAGSRLVSSVQSNNNNNTYYYYYLQSLPLQCTPVVSSKLICIDPYLRPRSQW